MKFLQKVEWPTAAVWIAIVVCATLVAIFAPRETVATILSILAGGGSLVTAAMPRIVHRHDPEPQSDSEDDSDRLTPAERPSAKADQ